MPPSSSSAAARATLDAGPILLRWQGDVAVVTLNRPDKLNSFTHQMHEALVAALDHVEAGGARALLLTGAGRGFCAGQDLADLDFTPGHSTDLGELIDTWFNPLIRRLQALPLPVVAAVNGTAAGAGANRSACFIQAFVKIGLVPDSGGTWLLPKRLGMGRAMGLAMTGDRLSADEAEKWGLVWEVMDDPLLAEQAMALSTHLAAQPTRALAAIKRAMYASATNTLDTQLDLERDLQRDLGQSHDYTEGVNAFLAKRAPHFTGR